MTNMIANIVTIALTVAVTLAFHGPQCTTDEQCADIRPDLKCVQTTDDVKRCIDCPCLQSELCLVSCTNPLTVTCDCPPDTRQPLCDPTCHNPSNPCGINTICFDNNGTSAVSCTCEPGYTGNPTSAEGCNQVSSGGGEFTGESGTFRYPLIPGTEYENFEDRSWTITTTPVKILKVTFISFDVEPSWRCSWDSVRIYNGDEVSDPLLANYCGLDTIPAPVFSTHNQLYIRFQSDFSITEDGFEIQWTSEMP